jgi:DNA-binding response OmpR family regulator
MAKILVAEDDKFLANAYRIKFGKAGYDVQIASDGQEAIDILGTFEADIILLDLIMPIKDGFAVLDELRKNEKWKNIPVIVASNLGQKEDIDKSMLLGARDYIVKSDMHLNEVLAKISHYLK